MESVIDHEKKDRLQKAANMKSIPEQLDALIRLRQLHASVENVDAVEAVNEMIRKLLGL